MATTTRLSDEADTKQVQQCRELGADLYVDDDQDDDEPGYGADPFDILAHKQETSQ